MIRKGLKQLLPMRGWSQTAVGGQGIPLTAKQQSSVMKHVRKREEVFDGGTVYGHKLILKGRAPTEPWYFFTSPGQPGALLVWKQFEEFQTARLVNFGVYGPYKTMVPAEYFGLDVAYPWIKNLKETSFHITSLLKQAGINPNITRGKMCIKEYEEFFYCWNQEKDPNFNRKRLRSLIGYYLFFC